MRVPVIPVLLFAIYVSLLGNHIVQSFLNQTVAPQEEQQLFPYLWDDDKTMQDQEPEEGSFFMPSQRKLNEDWKYKVNPNKAMLHTNVMKRARHPFLL